jgi:putative ABC transport system permease protein
MTSGLSGVDTDLIKQAPGLLRDGNRSIASAELFVIVDLNKRSTGTPANVPLRGIEPAALQVRDEIKVIAGRMFRFRQTWMM